MRVYPQEQPSGLDRILSTRYILSIGMALFGCSPLCRRGYRPAQHQGVAGPSPGSTFYFRHLFVIVKYFSGFSMHTCERYLNYTKTILYAYSLYVEQCS
jgi:hypothetical protein